MDFKIVTPHFHQAAIATAFTFTIISPVASWAALCATPANPFVVNIATESDDACDDQISLREAITYANNNVGKDAITFADSLNGQTIEATQTAITITDSVSITGPTNDDNGENAGLITLKASDSDPLFNIYSTADRIEFNLSNAILEKTEGGDHIIKMDGYGGDVVLDKIQTIEATQAGGIFDGTSNGNEQASEQGNDLNLTLKNSNISGSIFSGTILETDNYRNASSRISIEDSTVNNANAYIVAYVSNGGNRGDNEQDMAIQILRSNITGNTVTKIAQSYSYYSEDSASIDVIESTISGNTISYNGIRAAAEGGTLNIQSSTLCDNLNAGNEGNLGASSLIAADDATSLSISNSKICNNQQPAIRISTWGSLNTSATIENTIISNNSSEYYGAGIDVQTYREKLDLNIIDSSITGNKNRGHGGGIAVKAYSESELNLNIINSTLSNNQAGYESSSESALAGTGGGIWIDQDADSLLSVNISSSTINENVSAGLGGGIANYDQSASIQIENSIIANNISGNETDQDVLGSLTISHSLIGDLTTNDLALDDGQLLATTINGIHIESIGDGEGQTSDIGNNILGQDPLLQDLTFSGGTWVHPLNADSPAIAAGNADIEDLPEFDQRGEGFTRVRDVDGTHELDMGAVQYFATPVAVNDAISVAQNSENNSVAVLENDAQNSNGLPLDVGSVTIMTHPENGNAEALADGSINYTPNAKFFGTDSLVYIVQDIDGNTSTEATVNITVTAEVIADERSDSDATGGSGGGALHFWLLSFFGLLGLRRKQKTTD